MTSESSLSIAYVHAVAAHAGYTCGEPPGPDRDSVDIQIAAGGSMRPKIDLQLKATTRLSGSGEDFSFPLKVKNYEDLRIETQTPRILVVLDLPAEREEWLSVTVEELVIRRAAYWLSLKGWPPTENSVSVTVRIPKSNIFDTNTLCDLMAKSRTGSLT